MGLIGEFFFTLVWAMSFSLTALFLAARMLWVGLDVTPADLRATPRARGLLTRTLLANVLVVPALAVLLVTVLPLSADARLAILLLAVVPGGIDFLAWKDSPGAGGRSPASLVFLLSIVAVVVAPVMRILIQSSGRRWRCQLHGSSSPACWACWCRCSPASRSAGRRRPPPRC